MDSPSFRRRSTAEDQQDRLEDEQTSQEKNRRGQSEGEERDLTELAVPNPVDRRYTRRDSLERQETSAERRISHGGSTADRDTALTELAAPEPVETDEEDPSGEDTAAQSLDEENKPPEADRQQTPRQVSGFVTELYIHSWLVFFSLLGTLARLGVETVSRYPNAPVSSPVLWANFGGSLFMGFLSEDRRIFREEYGDPDSKDYSFREILGHDSDSITSSVHKRTAARHSKVKKTIPLFIGLATGFCGSFTSFSSFIRDAFLALTNGLAGPPSGYATLPLPLHTRNGGYSFMALLAILIIHPAISLAALKFGAHLALTFDPIMPTIPFRLIRRVLDPLGVFLGYGCWLGAVFLTIWPPGNRLSWLPRATFALVFAPLGCLLRFYLSKYLNSRIPSFPLGTFTVNIIGTVVLGMCYDLQHSRNIGSSPAGSYMSCSVLQGVMEGFCGCATTVSTWVTELNGLRRMHAYKYGLISVSIGLGCLVCIMGGMGWTIGFGTPVCVS